MACEVKMCRRCSKRKPLEHFSCDKNTKDGLQRWCKLCHAAYAKLPDVRARQLAKQNAGWKSGKVRDARYRSLFGITLEKYESMLAAQNGLCLVCGVPQTECDKNFSVDHCHETGTIRGLLCHPCNAGIGHLKDDTKLIQRALDYLEAYQERQYQPLTFCG